MTNVMFNREAIEADIVTLAALVSTIREKRGSAAESNRKAVEQALTEDVEFTWDDMPKFDASDYVTDDGYDNVNGPLVEVAVWVEKVNEWADQLRDETVTRILKGQTNNDDLAVLKEQYASKRTLVEAMITVCEAQGIDVTGLTIPALGGGRPLSSKNSTTSPRKPGSKWAHFYRAMADGTRKDQSSTQDTLSSFAYYHGQKVTQSDDRSVGALTKFLHSKGIESPLTKPWTIEVDGVTYGMEVTESPDPKTDDKSEEE